MSLNKDQFQKINTYLKSKGIAFWDVRYEFADHIACVIEEKLNKDFTFDQAFKEVQQDFSRKTLQKQQKQVQKSLNRVFIKSFTNEVKAFFLSIKKIFYLIVIGGIMKLVLEVYSAKQSFIVGFTFILFFIIMFLIKTFKDYHFHGKSMLLNLSSGILMFICFVPQFLSMIVGFDTIRGQYPNEFLGILLTLNLLVLSWFNCYSKLAKKQKKYYDLIYN